MNVYLSLFRSTQLRALFLIALTLAPFRAWSAEGFPPLPQKVEDRPAYLEFLQKRYGIKPSEVTWGKKYPLVLIGGAEKSFTPDPESAPIPVAEKFDTIIVGGGPAGLTSGLYLTDKNKKVLLLEREKLGGLGAGQERAGVQFGRGAAYFTSVDGIVPKLYEHIGLGDFETKNKISEPIDSLYWNGKLYPGLWENDETLKQLPASFSVFKFMLKQADKDKQIPTQPIEDHPGTRELDKLTFNDWVRQMPEKLKKLADKDPEAKILYDRFLSDPRVQHKREPMKDVWEAVLNNYGRSALGDHSDVVNAAAFANFYISEIDARYTGNTGDGVITKSILKKLEPRVHSQTIKLEEDSAVHKVVGTPDGVEVYYNQNGKTYVAKAPYAVMASPVSVSSKLIQDFKKIAPDHQAALDQMEYRHYAVINVHVKGHPWKGAYDLWVHDDKWYSKFEFTDIIDGRWMDFHGLEKKRTDDKGVLTIYLPLPKEFNAQGFTDKHAADLAEKAIDRMKQVLGPLAKQQTGEEIEVLAAEVNRWPFSIHVPTPGHFERAKVLKQPIDRIFIANNNLGTPAVEEGVYRGYVAARDILKRMKAEQKEDKWVPSREMSSPNSHARP